MAQRGPSYQLQVWGSRTPLIGGETTPVTDGILAIAGEALRQLLVGILGDVVVESQVFAM